MTFHQNLVLKKNETRYWNDGFHIIELKKRNPQGINLNIRIANVWASN